MVASSQASATASPARRGVVDQAARFVGFGILSAGVDFGIYQLLLHFGLWADVAKGISFICGTVTAYLLNRRWTFDSAGGRAPAIRFAVLYGATFRRRFTLRLLAVAAPIALVGALVFDAVI